MGHTHTTFTTRFTIASSYISGCFLLSRSGDYPFSHPVDTTQQPTHPPTHPPRFDSISLWLLFETHISGNGSQLQSTWTKSQKQLTGHKQNRMRKIPSSPIHLLNLNSPPVGHHGLPAKEWRASVRSFAASSFFSPSCSSSLSAWSYGLAKNNWLQPHPDTAQ